MNKIGKVLSVNISETKGVVKLPVESAVMIENLGLEGDAHAAAGIRQVSLLGQDSVDKMTALGVADLVPGIFAENITVEFPEIFKLAVGTKLRIGETLNEVSKIGKECHKGCAIKEKVGMCIMPTEGIFVSVIKGGTIKKGDIIEVIGE
ncbi:MAG: MOSC domain-containing protein [Oscillospiraceae bacterium]